MKSLRPVFVLVLLVLAIGVCYAKEGADQYPYGAENWMGGATPPPGYYYINYFGFYSGVLKDGSGHDVNLDGVKPDVGAMFNAFRFLDMTQYKVLGANWGVHVIVPTVSQTINMPVGTTDRGGTAGVGDIVIDPMVLGWHQEHWHAVAAFDVDLPTGHYEKNDPRACIGAHYYSFEPIAAFTYLPNSGVELSTKFMYNVKTTNQATDYHSGQEFHADYLAGKHFGRWMLGASGYALKQVTDDTVNGVTVPAVQGVFDEGRKGQVFAIGTAAAYETKSHVSFSTQWQHETAVRNRFGGDKVWLKLVIPL